jgi:hypothetical protein
MIIFKKKNIPPSPDIYRNIQDVQSLSKPRGLPLKKEEILRHLVYRTPETDGDMLFMRVLRYGFLFFMFSAIFPHNVHARDQLLLFYSGNVNGEIEGCG